MEKALKISEVIEQLEGFKKEFGNIEVFMTNERDSCFDGVGRTFVIKGANAGSGTEAGFTALALLRNSAVLKI